MTTSPSPQHLHPAAAARVIKRDPDDGSVLSEWVAQHEFTLETGHGITVSTAWAPEGRGRRASPAQPYHLVVLPDVDLILAAPKLTDQLEELHPETRSATFLAAFDEHLTVIGALEDRFGAAPVLTFGPFVPISDPTQVLSA